MRPIRVVRGGLCGLLVVLAGMAFASPARADQYDFVMQLDSMGVHYGSVVDVIDIGKELCHDLRSDVPAPVVLSKLGQTGFAPAEAGVVLLSAVDNMCLDAKPSVVRWARGAGYAGPM